MVQVRCDFFDLKQISLSGQCFRMEENPDGSFTVIARDRSATVSQKGNLLSFDCSVEEFDTFWKLYFDLDTDYGRFVSAVNPNDSYLVSAVKAAGGVRILKQDLWEMIVTFLISQQNNIPRIKRCIRLICESYGEKRTAKDGSFYYAFPEPEAFIGLSEDALMACNLGYRSKYVVRTAHDVVCGRINLERIAALPYKKAKQELLACFGVGEKVADCICLFSLHHLDAFPVDTHIRQVLDTHYKRGFPNRRYKGYRGVMQQYIFYYELIRNKS